MAFFFFSRQSTELKEFASDSGVDDMSVDSHDNITREILKKSRSSKHGFTTNWGPIGFTKDLHPLSIMVTI